VVLALPYSTTHERTNPLKPRIWKSAVETQQQLLELGFQTCVIGGIAVQRSGEPRVTKDVDFTLLSGFGNERPIVKKILRYFDPELKTRKNLQFILGISLGGLPFEETSLLAPRSGRLLNPGA
jgi:hypothetical protein